MITLDAYFMGRLKTHASEFTPEIGIAAGGLIVRVNDLLREVGIEAVTVSSGWRPRSVNSRVRGAAKNSQHIFGHAVDLADPHGTLRKFFTAERLEKHGLYMESPDSTPTWVHLQDVAPRSGKRIFKP